MKTSIYVSLAVLCFVTGRGFTSEKAPLTAPIRARLIQTSHVGAQDISLLHRWENTQILGFNAQGRLFVHDGARQRFAAYELTVTNAAVAGWKNPDGGQYASGAFSPDGRTLATVLAAGKDQTRIRLWNSVTGEPLQPTFAPTDVAYLAFSPDGKYLAGLVSLDGTVRVWDVASGELRSGTSLPEPPQVAWTGIQFSPDGRHVAARNSFALSVWNVVEPKPVALGKENIYLTISPDWKLAQGVLDFAATLPKFRIELLDFADPGKPGPVPPPLANEIATGELAVAFSLDGQWLALSGQSNTVRFWDTVHRRLADRPTLNMGRASKLTFSPGNRLLLTYEDDFGRPGESARNVRLWEAATGQPCGPSHRVAGRIMDWHFDREARFLAVSLLQDSGYGAQVWKLPPGKAPPATRPQSARAAGQQSN